MNATSFFSNLFLKNYKRYEGVCPIQVYLLRLVFILTFVFVGIGSWSTIVNHNGDWNPLNAVAFSVWAAYSTLSVLGIIRPLKMLPIIAFQIFYKMVWLAIVAYPLWLNGTLTGSDAEQMTKDFLWVVLPIVAMPWSYFLRTIFGGSNLSHQQKLSSGVLTSN